MLFLWLPFVFLLLCGDDCGRKKEKPKEAAFWDEVLEKELLLLSAGKLCWEMCAALLALQEYKFTGQLYIFINVLAMYLKEGLFPYYRAVFDSQNLFEGILGRNGWPPSNFSYFIYFLVFWMLSVKGTYSLAR